MTYAILKGTFDCPALWSKHIEHTRYQTDFSSKAPISQLVELLEHYTSVNTTLEKNHYVNFLGSFGINGFSYGKIEIQALAFFKHSNSSVDAVSCIHRLCLVGTRGHILRIIELVFSRFLSAAIEQFNLDKRLPKQTSIRRFFTQKISLYVNDIT